MKSTIQKYIHIDPDICHGRPCFRGTRIPVSLILHMIEGGDSLDAILRGYPSLSRRAVQAVLHWAGEMIDSNLRAHAKAA